MLKQYYLSLFDLERSALVVVAPPNEAQQLQGDLMAAGFEVSHSMIVAEPIDT